MNFSPAQLRKHAQILRKRIPKYPYPEYQAMALAQAEKMESEADLADAKAGQDSGVAESAVISRHYPIIGNVDTEGGAIVKIEHPFGQDQIEALEKKDIHIAFEWSFDPAAGLDEGRLYRIYIGTTTGGPCAVWYNGRWRRLHSNDNFGKKYAFGGTWSSDKETQPSLLQATPDVAAAIVLLIGDVL